MEVVWSRQPEPALDREIVNGIILKLMDIDEKLRRVLIALEVDDGEEEEEDDA
jgi:hypothetical protein